MSTAEAGLTISAVAARTGLSVTVLRSWEQRHGFPRPARLDGGHRRYDDDDVTRILRVKEERAGGRSLEAAIALAQRSPETPSLDETFDATIYAGLRRRRPDLEARVIGRRTMLALSRAIEEECLAQGDSAHLTAAFQTRDAYDLAQPRWQELIATCETGVVFADFPRSRSRRGLHQIAIPGDAPLAREWSVVCDSPHSSALLAAWERADGRFEAFWSIEPEAVRLGTLLGRAIAARLAPRLDLPPAPTSSVDPATAVRRATAITNRVVAYLDR
jgi:DNA-binding transcriptional MerR regulator